MPSIQRVISYVIFADEETSTDSPPPYDLVVDEAMFALRAVSVAYGLAGLACTVTGIFVLIYADPIFVWPYVSGSGIWTGVLVSKLTLIQVI